MCCPNKSRSESEEEDRKTSLQGQIIKVNTVADCAPPTVNVIAPEEGTLQAYFWKRENENTNAQLKKLHGSYEKEKARKRTIIRLCSTLARKILPTLAVYFVLTYWSAGLLHYHRINHLDILGYEVTFTMFYFIGVLTINYVCKLSTFDD